MSYCFYALYLCNDQCQGQTFRLVQVKESENEWLQGLHRNQGGGQEQEGEGKD